jgi:hypothetical protein
MSAVFAGTFYFLALANRNDAGIVNALSSPKPLIRP